MTLLVVLGIVVVVTILVALFLSLKSGRNRDGASASGGRQGRGGSRSERSPSLGSRARSLAGRDRGDDEYPGRRVAGRKRDDFDDDFNGDFGPPQRGPGGAGDSRDRSSLVTSGAGRRPDRGRPRDQADGTDAGYRGGYGDNTGPAGYGGSPSGPMSAEPRTEVFGSGEYQTPDPSARPRSRPGRSGAPGGYRESGRDDFGPPEPGFGSADRKARPAPAGHDFEADQTTTSFSDPGTAPGRGRGQGRDADEDDQSGGGRRRVTDRIQRPRLRRDKSEFDNDPWPGYDEDDSAMSDDKYWANIYSDRPLSTTARTAHAASETDQGWAGPDADPASPQAGPPTAGPEQAPRGRGRRARRHHDDGLDAGTEPRPVVPPGLGAGPGQPTDPGMGGGRHGVPRPSRPAEEDPLTSESFSRHAREGADTRSYRGPQPGSPNRPPSHGRPDSGGPDTQAMRPDPRGYGADPLTGPSPLSRPPASGRGAPPSGPGGGYPAGGAPGGGYPAGPGGGYPNGLGAGYPGPAAAPGNRYPNGPGNGYSGGAPAGGPGGAPGNGLPPAGRPDPYSGNGYRNGPAPDNGYRNGAGPGGYPDRTVAYPPPGRGGGRPPLPGPAGGPPPGPGYPPANGRPPAPGGTPSGGAPRRARPALPAPGPGSGSGSNGTGAPNGATGPNGSGPNGTGPNGPGGDRRPAYNPYGSNYPGAPNGSPGYPGTPNGTPGYPGNGYPGPGYQGDPNRPTPPQLPPAPGGPGEAGNPNGTGGHGRGRRGTNRPPDEGYDDPYGRDDRRY